MNRRLTRRVSLGAIAAGALLLAVFAPSASAGSGDRPKPDLVITKAEATGSHYSFKGVDATLAVSFKTKNKGEATAGRSRSVIALEPEFAGRTAKKYELRSRRVPELGPGDVRGFVGGRFDFSTGDLPLGAYDIVVCADYFDKVREEREGNNCTSTDREFFVVNEDWLGKVSGDGAVAGAPHAEKWRSGGVAHLSFGEYLGDGAFRYDFNGVVQWTDNGTNSGGCTYTGSGTQRVDEDNSGPGITLNYGKAKYKGTEALDSRFYTIFASGMSYCTTNLPGPVAVDFMQIPGRPLRFNQNELKGTESEPGVEGTTWKWDFS